ncbi:hypothetical protein [Algibacter sp. 2305UL17-15]|uniref:hypothetical protein n=1 Tax=Algibacter sp. 2305UL17-15 TaxID=3231268 RepID=UPI00345880E9
MIENKKRKEVTLDSHTIELLKIQAEKEGRKLKNYMEHILKDKANSFELSEAYKSMMDDMLDKHSKGELKYVSEEEFRKRTAR